MHHQYLNITRVERYKKPSLSRINGGENATKKLKDVFHQGSPSLSLFKWDVAYSSIFVFSWESKCTTIFSHLISLYEFSDEIWLFLTLPYHAAQILEHYKSWEVQQTFPSRISGGKNATKQQKDVYDQGSPTL